MNNNNNKKENVVKAKGMWKGFIVYAIVKLVIGLIAVGILILLLKTGGIAKIYGFLFPGTAPQVERMLNPSGDEWWRPAMEDPNYDPLVIGEDGVTFGGQTYTYEDWDADLQSMLGE